MRNVFAVSPPPVAIDAPVIHPAHAGPPLRTRGVGIHHPVGRRSAALALPLCGHRRGTRHLIRSSRRRRMHPSRPSGHARRRRRHSHHGSISTVRSGTRAATCARECAGCCSLHVGTEARQDCHRGSRHSRRTVCARRSDRASPSGWAEGPARRGRVAGALEHQAVPELELEHEAVSSLCAIGT